MSYGGIGTSPVHGNESVAMHSVVSVSSVKVMVELILRILVFGFGVVAAILIASATEVKVIFSITKTAKFTYMKALVLLVVINGIVASYSLLQLVRCVAGLLRNRSAVIWSKPVAWLIFSSDQVMAYMSMAAVAAAAQSAEIGKVGQTEMQWMKICDMYGKYCKQVGEGIASSVVVGVCTIILSCMSAYSLFRNNNKSTTTSTSTW